MVIFLMLICALLAVTAFSLLATAVGMGTIESMQAFSTAIGGEEWYLEQLANDSDWSNEADQADIALGSGAFDVTINSAAKGSISFTITGKAAGEAAQREVSITASRFPPAAKFAVYWGRDTGSFLQIRNSSTIDGDLWSRGTTEVLSGNSVTGTSYCPDNENISGTGSFTEFKVISPYPGMPQIDESYYDNLISTYNALIAAHGTNSDSTLSTNLNLTGGFYGYRTLETTGNITISGNGFIVASRDINLHASASASGTLTISPSGGNIYFLAGRSLTVNSTQNDTNVAINGDANNRVYLYSQDSATSRLVRIRKHSSTATTVDSAVVIGQRRIIVEGGARITNSTLYVSDVSDTNNYLQITDSGTAVGTPGNPCNLISVSGRDPGLIINNGASVTGFVYHWGDNTGYAQVNGATIAGSLVASQFTNDRIVNSDITYSAADLPAAPDGFEGFVSTDTSSWDDK